ncbi:MAG TPA: alpha-amylase family glycosyl hydrolase, partial [Bacteroidales bacterium]|nr:alpha-amylase family glycosyl hydrolase [Bacteroidales bacterium]
LEEMGVNVLELMPVNEFEGNISWGYNPSFYFAPDKAYGPRSELKRLIDEAHQRGMAVFIDLVLNHSYGQSPLVQMYFDNGAPAEDNPWYNRQHNFENPDAHWGYDFNHESPYTEALVDSINTYWMSEYKVDGFRFDFTKGFSNNIKDDSDPWGSNYDADRVENLKRMSDAIWEYNSDAVVSMEHLAENSEETELANYGILLWGNLNHNYNEGLMGWTDNGKSDLRWGSYQARGWDEPNLLTYMESHDEERLIYKALEYGNQDNPEHDVQELDVALERAGLAATFLFAIPGPKMIWQFGELGYDYSIDYDCRTCPKPVRWDYLDDYRRDFLYDVYGALAHLKTNYDVFSTTDFSIDVRDAMKHVNLNGEDMDAVIIGNFDVYPGEITPQFSQTGTWYDYITGDSLEVSSTDQSVTLQQGEYRVYTSEKITPSGLSVSIEEYGEQIESTIFPNPSSDQFNITFKLNNESPVTVKAFDVYGREVARLFDGNLEAGNHEVAWKPEANNPKGVYIIEITSGNEAMTKKVLFK